MALPLLQIGARVAGVIALALLVPAAMAAAEFEEPATRTRIAAGTGKAAVAVSVHDTKHTVYTTVPAGTIVHQSIAVTGSSGTPTGTVSITRYAGDTCTTLLGGQSGIPIVNGGVDLTGDTQQHNVPTTVSYKASYSGDATYAEAVSPCTKLVVTKATPSMTTTMHDDRHNAVTSVLIGEAVHANVALSGGAGTPTGNVTLRIYYDSSTCSGTAAVTQNLVLASGTKEGDDYALGGRGIRSFQATYNGDTIYNARVGACKVVEWVRPSVLIGLVAHEPDHSIASTVEVGTLLHVAGTLGGPLGPPAFGGTLTVRVYENGACTGTPASSTNISYAAGAFDSTTPAATLQSPGRLSFTVTYGGDEAYLATTSGCLIKTFKATPTVTVTPHGPGHVELSIGTIKTLIHGAAEVDGAFATPTGTVDILVYQDSSCTDVLDSGSASLSGGSVDPSSPQVSLDEPDTISWRAHYDGNGTYLPADSACVVLPVQKARPTVTATIHDAAHVASSSIELGEAAHPRVTVTGSIGTPTGKVLAFFFPGGDCSQSGGSVSAAFDLASGAFDFTAFPQSPASPGSYSFLVNYLGNASYDPGWTVCTTFVVLAPGATPPPSPTPAPTLAPGATPTALPSWLPGTSPDPGAASPGASASAGPPASAAVSAAPVPTASAAPAPGGGAGTGEGVSPVLVVGLLALVVAVGVGAFVLGRRGERPSA